MGNFELAIQPEIDEEERKRLLHIVIVGGGPTGVEFGAELYDFVSQVCVYRHIIDVLLQIHGTIVTINT